MGSQCENEELLIHDSSYQKLRESRKNLRVFERTQLIESSKSKLLAIDLKINQLQEQKLKYGRFSSQRHFTQQSGLMMNRWKSGEKCVGSPDSYFFEDDHLEDKLNNKTISTGEFVDNEENYNHGFEMEFEQMIADNNTHLLNHKASQSFSAGKFIFF